MKIKVGIADDHPIVVEGIGNLLRAQPQLEVTATYPDGRALLDGLKQQQPDVLLLDIQFPDMTGNQLVRLIKPLYPDMRILVFSSVDNLADIKDMMKQGCSGYILKNVALQVLVAAIEKVYAGEEFLEPELKEQLFQSMFSKNRTTKSNDKLTQREQKLLELIAGGRTNVEIADELCLSYRTIQNNRLSLYQKFDVHNTAELLKIAILRGLVE